MLQNTKYSKELFKLQYRSILESTEDAASEYDFYLRARSAIILGSYRQAEDAIAAIPPVFAAIKSFLSLQVGIYRRDNLTSSLPQLSGLLKDFYNDRYLTAEVFFVLSYAHFINHQNDQGILYLLPALDSYRDAGLHGHVGVALFNLAVVHNHLNDKLQFKRYRKQLNLLANECSAPSIRLHKLRLDAYIATDNEEYARATKLCVSIMRLAAEEKRFGDFGGVANLAAYLYLKQRRISQFKSIVQRCMALADDLPQHLLVALPFFERAAYVVSDATAMCDAIIASGADAVNKVFALDLLAESLERQESWEDLFCLAQRASQFAKANQQGMHLVDFDRYLVRANLGLGRWLAADAVLKVYEARAVDLNATAREARGKHYRYQLRQLRKVITSNKTPTVSLDTDTHTLAVNGQVIDLSPMPLTEHLYAVLIRAKGAVEIPDLFEMIYGVSFRQDAHGARFKTLIDRARKVCTFASLILRRGRHISLNQEFTYTLSSKLESPAAPARQTKLISVVQRSAAAMSVSDILQFMSVPKRTLQFDLKQLVSKKILKRKGHGRTSRYQIMEKNP